MPILPPIPLPLADAGGVIFAILLVVSAIVSIISANAKRRQEEREMLTGIGGDEEHHGRTEIDSRIDDRHRQRAEASERRQRRREIEQELRRLKRTGQPVPPALLRELGLAPAPRPEPPRPPKPKRAQSDAPPVDSLGQIRPILTATAIGTGNAAPSQRGRRSNDSARRLRRTLGNRDSARNVIVAAEVLGKPLALRDNSA